MRLVKLEAVKTYATAANAEKAAEAKFGSTDLRYFIMRADDGRYFPVFLGQRAITQGVHFHFNVVA